MWSRKSAMLGSLAIAMYLLGLTLRNEQLVTIAVVIFVFLTWAALFGGHADVASSGRRADEWSGEEGIALGSVIAMRKLSSARLFEDGELNVTLRMQNNSPLPKILEVRDRVPEVLLRIPEVPRDVHVVVRGEAGGTPAHGGVEIRRFADLGLSLIHI